MATRSHRWVRAGRLLLVIVIGVGLGAGLTAWYVPRFGPQRSALGPDVQEFIRLINSVRAQSSCPAMRPSAALMGAAQEQAQDMVSRGFLSPVNPENEDPATRASRYGYTGTVTESYAAGLNTPADVVRQWTNGDNPLATSVNQRIRACRMVSIGIGHDDGTAQPGLGPDVWVMTLGDR